MSKMKKKVIIDQSDSELSHNSVQNHDDAHNKKNAAIESVDTDVLNYVAKNCYF